MSVHFIIPTIGIPETGYPHRHGVQVVTSSNLTPLGCPSLARGPRLHIHRTAITKIDALQRPCTQLR